MRRSPEVFAPLLAAAAVALLTGCHTADPKRCVDENNHLVDPSFCKDLPGNQPLSGTRENNGGYYSNGFFFPHFYRFYYGGTGGGLGSILTGGGYAPLAGHSYAISGGTSRGGFGSSFSSSGSGGGE